MGLVETIVVAAVLSAVAMTFVLLIQRLRGK